MDRICYARMIGRKITTNISFVEKAIFLGRKAMNQDEFATSLAPISPPRSLA